MADSGIRAIDRVFDVIDGALSKADRVLNRAKATDERTRRVARGAVVDTAPSVKVRAKGGAKLPKSAASAAHFRIVEAIAAETGTPIFIVTNGAQRAECTTRELAEQVLRMLEAAAS